MLKYNRPFEAHLVFENDYRDMILQIDLLNHKSFTQFLQVYDTL